MAMTIDLDDHRDERGFVLNPFAHLTELEGVSHCHVFSMAPGSERGGHAHGDRDEQILIVAGTLRVVLGEPDEEVVLSASEPRILIVAPGRHHRLRNDGPETVIGMCWAGWS